MNVFLDTNVVLTGSLNPYGPSSSLVNIANRVKFFTSQRVIQECVWNLEKKTDNPLKIEFVKSLIDVYFQKLNITIVQDYEPQQIICSDKDDQYIYDSALNNNCQYICTYNIKDFPNNMIKSKTPHYLMHEIDNENIENYVQYPLLSEQGTMLFIGKLHHKSSMGDILYSNSGIKVYSNKNGTICIEGDSVRSSRSFSNLEGNTSLAITLRYNKSHFEASRWIFDGIKWNKKLLTTAECSFSRETKPLLFFKENHNFFGHVQNLSGITRYVKDKNMQHVLSNNSLETAVGSLDLKYVLDNIEINKTQDGFQINYPVRKN